MLPRRMNIPKTLSRGRKVGANISKNNSGGFWSLAPIANRWCNSAIWPLLSNLIISEEIFYRKWWTRYWLNTERGDQRAEKENIYIYVPELLNKLGLGRSTLNSGERKNHDWSLTVCDRLKVFPWIQPRLVGSRKVSAVEMLGRISGCFGWVF